MHAPRAHPTAHPINRVDITESVDWGWADYDKYRNVRFVHHPEVSN